MIIGYILDVSSAGNSSLMAQLAQNMQQHTADYL
jgi:hypothetical protein